MFPALSQPFDVAAADIDLDGDLDVAVAVYNGGAGSVWVYQNKGSANWSSSPASALKLVGMFGFSTNPPGCNIGDNGIGLRGLTFGHFEFAYHVRDAYPDIAVAVGKTPQVWYLRNSVNDPMAATKPFVSEACQGIELANPLETQLGIVAADFDGDSYDDVVVGGKSTFSPGVPRLAVVWNNAVPGSDKFDATYVDAVPFTGQGYALDLTYAGGVDSSPTTPRDVVMTSIDTNFVYVFKDGTGETINFFGRSASVASRGITAAPLNVGDSHWDLATSNPFTTPNDLRWLEAIGGTGTFELRGDLGDFPLPQPPSPSWQAYPHAIDSGKINGDNLIDVVVANEGALGFLGNISIFINNGIESPLFGPRYDFYVLPPDPGPVPPTDDTGPVKALLADLDGDGYLDIVTANLRDHTISVLINDL
ncbi:MAG: VCBS repeat-containing protein [Phycisphaerales bacterium]|nr:VCBS repeat-containing protein [Phycisphaerales bacterium]